MNKFAKLFETDLGQILVFKDFSENKISIFFDVNIGDIAVSSINIEMPSEDLVQKLFDDCTVEKAYAIAKEALIDFKQMLENNSEES